MVIDLWHVEPGNAGRVFDTIPTPALELAAAAGIDEHDLRVGVAHAGAAGMSPTDYIQTRVAGVDDTSIHQCLRAGVDADALHAARNHGISVDELTSAANSIDRSGPASFSDAVARYIHLRARPDVRGLIEPAEAVKVAQHPEIDPNGWISARRVASLDEMSEALVLGVNWVGYGGARAEGRPHDEALAAGLGDDT